MVAEFEKSRGRQAVRSYGIGQSVQRVEDKRFLTGKGRYVDDISISGQCHASIVYAPHAHARIRRIDTTAAGTAPGVLCVLTGADVVADGLGGIPPNFMPEDVGGPKGYRTARPILVSERARCVGDRVAMVVAETLAQARDAADLIEIDFETLSPVVTATDAVAGGAPPVWEECPANVCFTLAIGDRDATEAAFSRAAHRIKLTLKNNRLCPNPMEGRVAIGVYDAAEDSYTLHTSSQSPHAVRGVLANQIFHDHEIKFRIVSPDVGGGFGMKADAYPEDALVLWASRRCGRPVKWTGSRSEGLMSDNHGRDETVEGELALDRDGKILAMRAHSLHAVGAYLVSAAAAPIDYTLRYTPGAYDIATLWATAKAVFTHTSPISVYRGPGRAEGNYLIERPLDQAALALGIGPDEIRRRNLVKTAAMPYATQTGSVYDSGEFERIMSECMALADWQGFGARQAESERHGKLRGRSVIYYIEHAGIFNDRMELHFDPAGMVTIVAGTHSHGQGHATAFAQVVGDLLGIPFDQIRYRQGDTDTVPFGRGTYAARSSLIAGNALKLASDQIVAKARARAAFLMEVAEADLEFTAGEFRVAGTDRVMSLQDVAKSLFQIAFLPPQFSLGLDASATYSGDVPNYPNGCHVCEVEIDRETGLVSIDRYAIVDDVGNAINPMICEGQVHGSVAQGIGQALLEEVVYDRATGQLLSGSFMDYCMPRASDIGNLTTRLSCVPCKTNPLGVKGVGESGTIGAPPAVMNATLDALRQVGVTDLDMPATPSRVWRAMQDGAAR
jgi:aerobic carbon-monoxide dehydrogenase large subunit